MPFKISPYQAAIEAALVPVPAVNATGDMKYCLFCTGPIMRRIMRNGKLEKAAYARLRIFCGSECSYAHRDKRRLMELRGQIERTPEGQRPKCVKCKRNRAERRKGKSTKHLFAPYCTLCRRTPEQAARMRANIDFTKWRDKRTSYEGFTVERFNSDIEAQNYGCRICKAKFNPLKKEPHADHDHATNKYRAPLCGRCNSLLGWAQDDIETLWAAIQYLNEFSPKTEVV